MHIRLNSLQYSLSTVSALMLTAALVFASSLTVPLA
jgi:hypothetical protein